MCGIVGYIGKSEAIPILVSALKKLEYRGYDSAGIAFLNNFKKLKVYKTKGIIEDLEKILPNQESHIAIGHTRWSTHGRPNDINAHPHTSGNIAVVHNGIIENYQKLKEKLEKKYKFVSETDTEVIAHLINYYYNGNLVQSVKNALSELEGSYAIAVICNDSPDLMVVARKDSPLIVGVGENDNFVASDIPAVLKYTKKVIYLDDYDIAIIKKDDIEFFNNGNPITKEINTIEWDEKAAEKAGYEHFMLKEIHEQPTSVFETLRGRISELDGTVNLDIKLAPDQVIELNKIEIIACGTSYNAALVGKYLFEMLAAIPTTIEVASEFRYSNPILDEKALIIAITQSGETADTLAAIKKAKSYGCKTLAITNVVGSTITREMSDVLYTRAGPEIGVAATKTFTAQLASLYLLAIYIGKIRYKLSSEKSKQLLINLKKVSGQIQKILEEDQIQKIQECASKFANSKDYFFIGRNINYPIALEGALKLKEISYIHAEGYPAGELKHGPIALISEGVPVVAIATQGYTYEKIISNIKEVKARDACVIAIANESDTEIEKYVDIVLRIPDTDYLLSPILSTVVLQLLAYYTAKERNCNIDKPKHLAKSVTVE